MSIGMLAGLAVLGLLAIDPIGIALMPIFLAQHHPYQRSGIFLLGSFLALMMWGLVFANGGGQLFLAIERQLPWLMPTSEISGGIVLSLFAIYLYWRRSKPSSTQLNPGLLRLLQLSAWKVFLGGSLLVTTQSALDIIFILAMIRVGQSHLSRLSVVLADAAYAVAALLLQITVVVIFVCTPPQRKRATLAAIRRFMEQAGDQLTIAVSLLLGAALILNGILALTGQAHF